MLELHNDINRFIEHTYKEIKQHFTTYKQIEFCKFKLQGENLYIVYESKLRFIAGRLASYELKENGLILEKDNQYRYYNFKENYEKKEEIIKEFVEKYYS